MSTKVYVAAYFDEKYTQPGNTVTDWNRIKAKAIQHQLLDIWMAINPNNGKDFTRVGMKNAIPAMKQAGIVILGYIYLLNGNRPLAEVFDAMNKYVSFYGVDGYMFDECPNGSTAANYLNQIAAHRDSINSNLIIKGNPGTGISQNLIGIFDNYSIAEGNSYVSETTLRQRTFYPNYQKENFSTTLKVATYSASFVDMAENYVDLIYLQSTVYPSNNTSGEYGFLSTHFEKLCDQLASPPMPPPDTTLPMVSIIVPTDNQVINESTFLVRVQASDNVGIQKVEMQLDQSSYQPMTKVGNEYQLQIPVTEGTHDIRVRANDAAGNSSSDSAFFRRRYTRTITTTTNGGKSTITINSDIITADKPIEVKS